MSRASVLRFTQKGIYCPAGDFYIDPWRPVERAVITHAHADHARAGHGQYLSTDGTLPVMRHRLGDIRAQTLRYGSPHRIGDATLSFHPAGHVPGSAQVRVEVAGEVWVVSGDYKLEDDGLSTPFEPVRCHHFISECTFGLPVFHWEPQADVAADILAWWAEGAAQGQTCVLAAYSLGKAQRLMHILRDGPGPLLTHAAVEATNDILRAQGLNLPQTVPLTPETNPKDHPGALIIAPPGALDSAALRRFGPARSAFASGWMRLRGVRRGRGVERGFVISDHADWDGLRDAIAQTGAENVYVTHGYTDIFAKYLNECGYHAEVVPTQFGLTDAAPEDAA